MCYDLRFQVSALIKGSEEVSNYKYAAKVGFATEVVGLP